MQILYRGLAQTKEEMLASLRQASVLSVDTETVSLKEQVVVGVGVQWSDQDALYVPTSYAGSNEILPELLSILSDPSRTKIYFNGMFDLRGLYELADWEEGTLPYPDDSNIEDASIAAQVQGYSSHSLDDLSDLILGYRNEYSVKGLLLEAKQNGIKSPTTLDIPFESIATKCINDCKATWDLWHKLNKSWPNERNRECYIVDVKLLSVLLKMERKGLRLRPGVLAEYSSELGRDIKSIEDRCNILGFSPSSNREVGYYLASAGNILPFTKSGKQLRVDEDVLEGLDDPSAKLVLDYRKKAKLLSTYVVPWIKSDRAYTHYRLDLSTGRLASFERNFQNIPSNMRAIFGPDSKYFSWGDYSQIEMRIFAYLSHDKAMLEAYKNNISIHEVTYAALYPHKDPKNHDDPAYTLCKTFNFAMIYYAKAKTMAQHTKISLRDAAQFREAWLSKYPEGHYWMTQRMRDHRPYVESDFGRRMALPILGEQGAYPEHIDKCKINYVVQGTAADIIKRAMLLVDGDIRVQVHDELVVDGEYEFSKELEHIHPEMSTPFEQYRNITWH